MLDYQQGHKTSAGVLFERYHGEIYAYLLRTMHSADRAADATSNVFARMLKYSASFKQDARFKPWLYSIAVNVRNTSWKSHQRTDQHESFEDELSDEHAEGQNTPELSLQNQKQRNALRAAVESLESELKELVTLYLYQELTIVELSELYDVTTNAMRVRIHRALNQVKTMIKQSGMEL